jgi:hypothetical protein
MLADKSSSAITNQDLQSAIGDLLISLTYVIGHFPAQFRARLFKQDWKSGRIAAKSAGSGKVLVRLR